MSLVVAVLVPTLALAEAPKRLAVLEFRGTDVPQDVLAMLSDAARAGAFRNVERGRLIVMTRESIADMLEDADQDECTEGGCEIEIGEELGADYVVSGKVSVVDGSLVSTIKIYGISAESLLGLEIVHAPSHLSLMDDIENRVSAMVSGALGTHEPSVPKTDGGLGATTNLTSFANEPRAGRIDSRAVEIANNADGSWFFQTEKDGAITENDFVRRFAMTTGRSDANRFDENRSGDRIVVGLTLTVLGAGAMVFGFSQPTYENCATCPAGATPNKMFVYPVSLGASATVVGILTAIVNLINPDGKETDHSMSKEEAERLIDLHNEALGQESHSPATHNSIPRAEKPAGTWSFAAGPGGIGVAATF